MATLLIIDDDDQMILLLRRVLQQAGYHVLEATNGKDGIDIYKKSEPDLVIADIIMPEKDGLETIAEIRRLASDVKIIAISGGGRAGAEGYLRMAKAFGVDSTIEKPINTQELVAQVSRLLQQA